MLWVILAENSPNSRPGSPNFSTCSSTASTVIPNNYKRIVPGCGNESCTSDYIDSGSAIVPEVCNGTANGHQTISGGVGVCSNSNSSSYSGVVDYGAGSTSMTGRSGGGGGVDDDCGGGSGGGPLMMVQAAVIIGPKDSNINYGTKALNVHHIDIYIYIIC